MGLLYDLWQRATAGLPLAAIMESENRNVMMQLGLTISVFLFHVLHSEVSRHNAGDACIFSNVFTVSLTILTGLLYVMLYGVAALCFSCVSALLSKEKPLHSHRRRRTPRAGDFQMALSPVDERVATVPYEDSEDYDEECSDDDDLSQLVVGGADDSDVVENYNFRKVITNVYFLGLGCFCMLMSLQLNNTVNNLTVCCTQWLVAVSFFLNRRIAPMVRGRTITSIMRVVRRKWDRDRYEYILYPSILCVYPIVLAAHAEHMWQAGMFREQVYQLHTFQTICTAGMSVAGPIILSFMHKPQSIVQTLELVSPMMGLLSTYVLLFFFTATTVTTACIATLYMGAETLGSYNVSLDPTLVFKTPAVVATALSPFAAVLCLAACLMATSYGMPMDIAIACVSVSILRMFSVSLPVAREIGGRVSAFFCIVVFIMNSVYGAKKRAKEALRARAHENCTRT